MENEIKGIRKNKARRFLNYLVSKRSKLINEMEAAEELDDVETTFFAAGKSVAFEEVLLKFIIMLDLNPEDYFKI